MERWKKEMMREHLELTNIKRKKKANLRKFSRNLNKNKKNWKLCIMNDRINE